MNRTKSYSILGFLTLLNTLNFIDRQLLSSFSNYIVPDLGLTNTQYGILAGLAFIIFYFIIHQGIIIFNNNPRLFNHGKCFCVPYRRLSSIKENKI